jgi:hypothetical protein
VTIIDIKHIHNNTLDIEHTMKQQRSNRSSCSCCKIIFGTLIVGGIALGLSLYFGLITTNDIVDAAGKVKDTFTDVLNTDPFSGIFGGGTDANSTTGLLWRNTDGTGGLELEIVNALDERWYPYFEEAVNDWNTGEPDSLTLSTSKADSPDSSCEPIDGLMKVCNGNYGGTGWKGINELVYNGRNRILNSVAKMNEYYLGDRASDNEMLYTMCHEIGHGFGLAHTDENFLNTPLGNCLDYSSNVAPNLKPGAINFEKLKNMYGTVDGSRRHLRHVPSFTKGQHLRLLQTIEGTPTWVQENFREKQNLLVVGGTADDINHNLKNGWTILKQSSFGEMYQIDLGGGYHGVVSALLAV